MLLKKSFEPIIPFAMPRPKQTKKTIIGDQRWKKKKEKGLEMSFGTIPWHSDLENCRDLQQFDEFYNVLFCFFGNTRQTGEVP